MVTLVLEDLVDDGAPYPCSFEVHIGGYYRCERKAIGLLPQSLYKRLELPKTLSLAGSAICEVHRNVIERDYMS